MSLRLPLQVARYGALTALGGTRDGFAALLRGEHGFGPLPGEPGSDRVPTALPDTGRPAWVEPGVPVACVRGDLGPKNRTFALADRLLDDLLAEHDLDPRGLAVIFATTTSAMLDGETAVEELVRGGVPRRPIDFLWSHLPHQPALDVAARLGATGPALVVSTACTSGTVAIGVAADLVAAGRAERALVIGADALCRTTLHGFRSLSAYSASRCRPMDRARDGMAIGEGAAYLLLEPASAARHGAASSGARFELIGVATATDGYHLTAPDPEGNGVVRAIAGALGGLDPAAVDHVNAHATGTEANDAAEAASIARAAPRAAVSATKGASGHTLGAAGVIEAVWLLQSMEAGVIPPVVGLEDPVPGVDVSATLRERAQRVGVSVNLAFGGHNAAVAFRRIVPASGGAS